MIIFKLSTAYHPETDSQTERANQELKQYLQSYINYQQNNWIQWLPLVKFAANNAVSNFLKKMPFFANKGFYLKLSLNLFQLTDNQKAYNIA